MKRTFEKESDEEVIMEKEEEEEEEVRRKRDNNSEFQEKFSVGSLPTIMYIPDFISQQEHDQLLHHIYQSPVSKWKSLKNRRLQNWGGVVHEKGLLPQDLPSWISRITRRICAESRLFPSEINHVLINEYLPDQGIMPHQDGPAYYPVVAILSLGSPVVMDFTPHHSLRGGTVSSGNNLDEKIREEGGPTEGNTINPSDNSQTSSVVLMPCSLLVFKDEAYSDYLHGIKDCSLHHCDKAVNIKEVLRSPGPFPTGLQQSVDTATGERTVLCRNGTRVSLTCRLVTKVHRNLFRI